MNKMYRCEDGTMISVDEILSVAEAKKYKGKNGRSFRPKRIFTSESEYKNEVCDDARIMRKDVLDDISNITEFIFELPFILVSKLVAMLVAKIRGKPFHFFIIQTDAEIAQQKAEASAAVLNQVEEFWKHTVENGYYTTSKGNILCMKQWDVTVRNQKKPIRITNSDYNGLCAEMDHRRD